MRKAILRAVCAGLFICGLGGGATAQTIVTNADSGTTVSVQQGQPFVVELTGQHEDGRYWRIDTDPTPQLILSGRTTNSVAVAGAPETTIFTYTTGDVGTMMFRASYLKAGAPLPSKSDVAILVNVTPAAAPDSQAPPAHD